MNLDCPMSLRFSSGFKSSQAEKSVEIKRVFKERDLASISNALGSYLRTQILRNLLLFPTELFHLGS